MPEPVSDPRLAALQHAAACEVGCHADDEHAVAREAVHAIVCGLVYVGDQVGRRREAEPIPVGPVSQAFQHVELAARDVCQLLEGEPGRWRYSGVLISDEMATPLLSLVDWLNTLDNARANPAEVARYFEERGGADGSAGE